MDEHDQQPQGSESSSSAPQSALANAASASSSSSAAASRGSLFSSPSVTSVYTSPIVATTSTSTSTSSSGLARPNPLPTAPSVPAPARRPLGSMNSSHTTSIRVRRFDGVEKDADDPTMSEKADRSYLSRSSTPSALNTLFKRQSEEAVPRGSFYSKGEIFSKAFADRIGLSESSSLPGHLLNRGFLSGLHSDITVHAFGRSYPLHRLLLDRAPFFSSAFSPSSSWIESSARDIYLQPESNDPNITQESFETALKSLYGVPIRETEDAQAMSLLATACWLGMAELIVSSVDSILRQLTPHMTAQLIVFVTSNYYGIPGERLLASAKAMLYKEGWEMPLSQWDHIPGSILREVIGGDGFFVPGEWERWGLVRRLLERRLRARGVELGILDAKQKRKATSYSNGSAEDTLIDVTVMSATGSLEDTIDSIYGDPNIHPLVRLLEEGIYYMHMTFEQLQYIRSQRDCFGRQIVTDTIISDALWMAMELRQKVINSSEADIELGLKKPGDDPMKTMELLSDDKLDSQSGWDDCGEPRRYWIPSEDSTSVIGDSHDTTLNHRADRSLPGDFTEGAGKARADAVSRSRNARSPSNDCNGMATHFSTFPPFRFSADFPSPRALKEKKRLYSKTVWYAGSLWNIYIQKVKTKTVQLGVYLHRAREQSRDEVRGVGGAAATASRSALMERFSSLDKRDPVLTTMYSAYVRERDSRDTRDAEGDDDDSSGSGGEPLTTLPMASASASTTTRTPLSSLLASGGPRKASQTPLSMPNQQETHDTANNSDEDWDDFGAKHVGVPTIPPYTDTRPTIKTYFKIYSPSKGGRMLSVYESAPDKFNFSQSWGWKSSTLIIDDGIMGGEELAKGKDGRLKFMVVLGNV